MSIHEQRLKILKDVEEKLISVEEGERKLAALEDFGSVQQPLLQEGAPDVERPLFGMDEAEAVSKEDFSRLKYWKSWWIVPFVIGLAITLLGGVWMYNGYESGGLGWGFWLSWIPLIIGLILTTFAWASKDMAWVHVRIKQKEGEKPQRISISLPVPFGIAAVVFQMFDGVMPEAIRGKRIHEVIRGIKDSVSSDEPLYVNVYEEDGEHVEVYIG